MLLFVGTLTFTLNIQTGFGKQGYVTIIQGESTLVSGYISENTTWTLEGSPYIVVGDVVVELDVSLTIEPGVTVKFTAGTGLAIDGNLIAQGNSTHKITFTSNSTTPASGDWGSIRFRDSSDPSCIIQWATLEYGTDAIRCEFSSPKILNSYIIMNERGVYTNDDNPEPNRPTIENNTISDNSGAGIYCDYNSVTNILNNVISYNEYGIYSYRYCLHEMNIEDNIIVNNTKDGIFIDRGNPHIFRNTIRGNGGNGIYINAPMSSTMISLNSICNNNGSGIVHGTWAVFSLTFDIIKNDIRNNKNSGIRTRDTDYSDISANIHFNNIMYNTPYDTTVEGSDNVNATNNWWGTTNETLIEEHIYDYYDDYDLGRVFYEPYLLGPIAKATVLDFSLDPNPAYIGQEVVLSGRLTDLDSNPVGNATVELSYSTDGGGNWTNIGFVTTNSSGAFEGQGVVTSAGSYLVRAYYNGSAMYGPSNHIEDLMVLNKIETKTFVSLSPNPASPGENVTLEGVLLDESFQLLPNENIRLYARLLSGSWRYITSLTTNEYGVFMWQAEIPFKGVFIFAVYYPGSEMYESTYSLAVLIVQ